MVSTLSTTSIPSSLERRREEAAEARSDCRITPDALNVVASMLSLNVMRSVPMSRSNVKSMISGGIRSAEMLRT